MMDVNSHADIPQVVRYFRAKSTELKASAKLAICEHSGLIGGHREELQRIFLAEILPKRFSVGRGMVYGLFGLRSREADIVIWDSQNYPSLPLLDHSFFFAESVRLVIECKSVYSAAEFSDVLEKCKSIREIPMGHKPGLAEDIAMIKQELHALREGLDRCGAFIVPFQIATAAVFLSGGEKFIVNPTELESIDQHWPDVTLFLGPGKVLIKNYGNFNEGDKSHLEIYDLHDDALLLFTDAFLHLLSQRSLQTEPPHRLAM